MKSKYVSIWQLKEPGRNGVSVSLLWGSCIPRRTMKSESEKYQEKTHKLKKKE